MAATVATSNAVSWAYPSTSAQSARADSLGDVIQADGGGAARGAVVAVCGIEDGWGQGPAESHQAAAKRGVELVACAGA